MSTQTDLGSLPHWDLANVYPSIESDEFQAAVQELEKLLDQMDDFLVQHEIAQGATVPVDGSKVAATLSEYLDQMNTILRLNGTLGAYLYSFIATDSYNTLAAKRMSQIEMLGVRIEGQDIRFRGWIRTLSEEEGLIPSALETGGSAADHRFYIHETVKQAKYLMSEPEETLASELSLSGGNAWGKLQGVVTSQIKVPFERDGELNDLPITVIINMRSDPDADIRERAYRAELDAWEKVREPLAACMNGVKGHVTTLYKRREREDALHKSLDQARIDRPTLDAMMGAMHASFPRFREYWAAKARRLNRDQLPWWDLFAPTGKFERRFTFPEAQEFILDNFATYSSRLADFARKAFERRWIDAEPRDGKRGGAFCMEVPAVDESRIMCNYDGSLEQLTTVAHELGHGYHNECQIGLTEIQKQTPMTLAETASIFCQTIITNAALGQAKDENEELAILENFLIDSSQVIVDIYSRYLFETEVFNRRADAELSADDFCELMSWAQGETYGEGLDPAFRHPYMWTWKPHYYSSELSFYNFPYAFGLLFGLGLYAIYKDRANGFLADYDELLRSTGAGTAADLAARFDIDIRSPEFWQSSIRLIEEKIERYVAIE
jgi:pepF/M3 family oligoendopeptidase